jgi:dihydrofolate reductase
MKVIMVMVATINGRTTKGDDPDIYTWTSPEDQKFFFGFIKQHGLTVMGSHTYEAIKQHIVLEPGRRRIILTSHPDKYTSIPGQLEFTAESPTGLVNRLTSENCKTMVLVGGAQTNSRFLESNVVDEMYITVEPILFGHGALIAEQGEYNLDLKLKDIERLNENGTLLLHYEVVK